MADFNPYRDLLHISFSGDKPDHYALLGVKQFESDPSKIDEAADSRMETLQEMSVSQHMDASQQLLNEVSMARRVLLDQTKRAAYDEELRHPKPASAATVQSQTAPTTSTAHRTSGTSTKSRKRTSRKGTSDSGPKKSGSPMMPIGITAGVVMVLAIVYFAISGGSGSGNVIVEWPMSERGNAEVRLNGKTIPFSNTNPVYLNVPNQGRSKLTFKRDGYLDIQKTISNPKGRVRMKLNWVQKQ